MKGAHFVVRLGKVRGQGRYIDPYGGSWALHEARYAIRLYASKHEERA